MIAASFGSWLAVALASERQTALASLLGMVGPLAIVSVTWVLMARTYRANPGRLMSLMMTAFAGKMVVFGAYVLVMLRVLALRPIPFVASFTAYFIGLYVMQAVCLHRMMTGRRSA